jgi:prepilin-type processing-associated H-X9-DG protein
LAHLDNFFSQHYPLGPYDILKCFSVSTFHLKFCSKRPGTADQLLVSGHRPGRGRKTYENLRWFRIYDKRSTMKTKCIIPSLSLLLILLMSVCRISAADSGMQTEEMPTPSRETSFEQVTARLAPGGNLYFYLSTESWWESLEKQWTVFREIFETVPVEDEEAAKIAEVLDLVARLYMGSGLREISGIGMSSVPVENGLYDSRILLHHYPDRGEGRIWTLFGEAAHPLNGLELLPETTQFAWFSDMDLHALWTWITSELLATNIPELRQGMAQGIQSLVENGINPDALLASLGNEYGLAITLDRDEMIPMGNEPDALAIPKPGLMIAIQTKNKAVYSKLVEVLAENEDFSRISRGGIDQLIGPPVPLPFPVRPVFAQTSDHLLICSHPDVLEAALAVKAGAPGLTSTEDFKLLSSGVPATGNEFIFVGRGIGELLTDLQQKAIASGGNMPPDTMAILQKLAGAGEDLLAFGVTRKTDEGWYHVSRSSVNFGQVAMFQASVAPTAVMAAMLLPAISNAREKARQIACMNNLKQIGLGLIMYTNDHDDNFPEPMGAEGLRQIMEYLPSTAVFACPSHGIEPPDPDAIEEASISYVYLGAPNVAEIRGFSSLPLAFDRPGNHKNQVNVLFADGHVEALDGQFSSCGEVIETLHSRFRYPENVLSVLRDKAARFDGY